nr:hypothetical protein [Candidatus Bathyarchaeota archaeon]
MKWKEEGCGLEMERKGVRAVFGGVACTQLLFFIGVLERLFKTTVDSKKLKCDLPNCDFTILPFER